MKNKFIIAFFTGLVILLSLYLTIIVKSGTNFEVGLLLAYTGIGLLGFIYSFILQRFKKDIGAKIFLVLSFISGLYFYISMPATGEGLSQIAAFLGWLILMFFSILIPLLVEFIISFIKRKKAWLAFSYCLYSI